MVEAAVPDVVGPPVSAYDPHVAAHEHVGEAEQVEGVRAALAREPHLQLCDAGALRGDAGLAGLVGDGWRREILVASGPGMLPPAATSVRTRSSSSRAYSFCLSSVRRIPRPNSALSSNSELLQAGPRPSRLTAQGVVGRLPP